MKFSVQNVNRYILRVYLLCVRSTRLQSTKNNARREPQHTITTIVWQQWHVYDMPSSRYHCRRCRCRRHRRRLCTAIAFMYVVAIRIQYTRHTHQVLTPIQCTLFPKRIEQRASMCLCVSMHRWLVAIGWQQDVPDVGEFTASVVLDRDRQHRQHTIQYIGKMKTKIDIFLISRSPFSFLRRIIWWVFVFISIAFPPFLSDFHRKYICCNPLSH